MSGLTGCLQKLIHKHRNNTNFKPNKLHITNKLMRVIDPKIRFHINFCFLYCIKISSRCHDSLLSRINVKTLLQESCSGQLYLTNPQRQLVAESETNKRITLLMPIAAWIYPNSWQQIASRSGSLRTLQYCILFDSRKCKRRRTC